MAINAHSLLLNTQRFYIQIHWTGHTCTYFYILTILFQMVYEAQQCL